MKVEEVVPGGLAPSGKLTLLIPKDDTASSSSDGADSGCLAESPEYGKEDSLCQSDSCITPDMARRDTPSSKHPQELSSSNAQQDATAAPTADKSDHIHSKSSSTTSESSSNLACDDWNQGYSQVVTSYIEINCNRNDVAEGATCPNSDTNTNICSAQLSHDANDNELCSDLTESSANLMSSEANHDDSNSPESLLPSKFSQENSSDTISTSVIPTEPQGNVTSEEEPSLNSGLPPNVNATHEITLSLSQLSDFEITKQKIKEMRKNFLTKLAAEGAVLENEDSMKPECEKPESSFLAHLQNKRANRLRMKGDTQNSGSNFTEQHGFPCANETLVPQALSNFSSHPRQPEIDLCHPEAPSYLSSSRENLTDFINQTRLNLDVLNANAPSAFHALHQTSLPPSCMHPSSLPPSISSSPIHYVSKSGAGVGVPQVNSSPNSPYHNFVSNVDYPRYSPNTQPQHIVGASRSMAHDNNHSHEILSRSADAHSFNFESFDYQRQYLRTRSLEESTKPTKKGKSGSPVSSFRKVFSQHKSNKNGVSPLNCIKANSGTLVSEINKSYSDKHTYENMNDAKPTHIQNTVVKSKNTGTESSNMWLLEKTVQLLRLKKNGSKNKLRSAGENKSDSDTEHKEQKARIKEACKDVARALFSLPNSPERSRETRSQSPPTIGPCQRILPSVVELERDSSLSRQVRRRQHLLSAAESSPRNSFHGSSSCSSGESCTCIDARHAKCHSEGLQRSPAFIDGWQKISLINRPSSAPNIVTEDDKKHISRSFQRRVHGSGDHSSSDDDYAEDYCESDEFPDACDYCSGDDAGDEEEDVCDQCQASNSVSSACKHSRVLTNGILKSCRSGRRCGREGGVKGGRVVSVELAPQERRSMPATASAAAGSAPNGPVWMPQLPKRRRSAAPNASSSGTAVSTSRRHGHGLGSIRESSATSDDQLDTDDEQHSHDGSNCDLSRSWRFGLSRDAVPSRDSTLCSDSSCTSVPADRLLMTCKEKSSSLPGAYNRPLPADPPRPRPGSTVIRLPSTSEEDTVIASSPPCNPSRPPRAPRTRCPSSPNPTSPALLSSSPGSPRPTMGVLGLQRSPNVSRNFNMSGLPPSPRLIHAPRTVATHSPNNPNPPYAATQTGGECAPSGSPRTSSRAGGLVTRNFSISDDENGRRCSKRQVTISRHETAYREAAEKGYVLPPGSPVDPYWLTWKLGVLQKTLEEVDGRLDVAEGTVSNWGPVPQDSNLAEQHVHNVTKFREGLSDLQRGVDDVNDQAARFSAHNIPLAADTSTRLHRLNARWKHVEGIVNDRWRQVAGRSRDVTPLTPAQLGSSVSHPWERAVANNKVPYYINHAQETTYWDHPEMMSLFDELAELNHIKFSAYRTAAKLRALQKKLALDQATLQLVTDVFDEHGLRGQNDRLIEVSDMVVVLSTLYSRIASDRPEVNTSLATDLCLNWLLNVYDSQRTGQMRVLSFRVGLVCLCKGHLEEKYRYVFRLIADPNRLVDQRKLGLLLHDCVQVPRQLGEVAAFGGSNIEPSVRSCFTKAGKDRETIEAVHFLSWVQQEPQSLVWLAVLHRVAASEHIQHQVKCNICKTCPIVGLRYRCLKCIGFDMCQKCFFEGRSSKSHKITHPMHEYCTATTAGDEMKDFTKALKNKFKSKRSLQKHTKKGYLPVQTVLEGDPLESPSPSPQHGVSSQDMHNRLEQYASRLAEVELRTNSNSTPDSEDEHGLIAQYCQSLSSGDGAALPVPRSPLQVMAAVDADQKDELEQMIRELEEENQALQAEYEQLRLQQEPSDSPQSSGGSPLRSEAEMLAEARLLRQHKGRLEARMTILEQHNQQLEAQLHRLRQLLQQNGGSSMNKSGTLQTKSVTASQLATDSPAKVNGHSGQGDLERAVGSLVATVTHDQERDSRSGSRQASEGREDEPFPAPQVEHEIEQYDNNPMPAEKDR